VSSWPGPDLEDFLMWQYDLIVDGDGSANPSLQIAEAVGVDTRRKSITREQFLPLLELFEPLRVDVERRLDWYNEEDCGSWRDYGGYAFDFIPKEIEAKAAEIVSGYRK
jgi:hypothetical protein